MSAVPLPSDDETRDLPVPLPEDGPLTPLVSVVMWAIGVAWLAPMMSGMAILSIFVPPWRTDWLNRLYCRGQLFLTGAHWKAEVHPDVDPKRVYMFCQNHTNHFDHVVLYNATPHFKQGLELEAHFKIPFYGWFMRARGTIPVRRGKYKQSPEIMAHMQSELDKGHSILAFPEGTRSLTGRVGKFRKGVFYIARDLGIPVVPVAVTGMYDVMRKGSWHIRPGYEVTVHCDKPIETAGLTDEAIVEVMREAQRVVGGHLDRYWDERRQS